MEFTIFDFNIRRGADNFFSMGLKGVCFVTGEGKHSSTMNELSTETLSALRQHWHSFDQRKLNWQKGHYDGSDQDVYVKFKSSQKHFWPIRYLNEDYYIAEAELGCVPCTVSVELHKGGQKEVTTCLPWTKATRGPCCIRIPTKDINEPWYVLFYARDQNGNVIDVEISMHSPWQHPRHIAVEQARAECISFQI
ncbi:hypothetical protein BKA56DRAFT_661171 [Ilyonectria sp. MPI-CAGE-AT-0026]|nr:hypothetical protein BKA56DRAFT_661171 [Ilyonectria sp. MPI-CAGE-AT-0026]